MHGVKAGAPDRRRLTAIRLFAILVACARAMNPCLVGSGLVHMHNRMFAAFRQVTRWRGTHSRSSVAPWMPPSICTPVQ
jgi:hypothetical protein